MKEATKEVVGQIAHKITNTTHLLETTTESWMSIEQIEIVEEAHKEIQQAEAKIVKLTQETLGLTPIQ